jgi:glycosyltransferase involved in cell wall biosynthesis
MKELSVILPCRNEESALEGCLKQIKQIIAKEKIDAEIIVSDSSVDGSPGIAKRQKVRLIKHDLEGYGNAYLEAFREAKGKYIFMADCDGSYDFSEIPRFLKYLREGYDFVMGDRFSGKIDNGAMPASHRHFGNPILSGILRLFFFARIRDAHCGMRAISREALDKLELKTTGMEFASEMVMKSVKKKLKIKQLPIDYHKRKGESKLRTMSDGWRHLRFMLIYSPLFLFFLPGLIFFLIGIETLFWFYVGAPALLGVKLYFHPMFISSFLTVIGYQLIIFSAFAKIYSMTHLGEKDERFEKLFGFITLERAGVVSLIMIFLGVFIYLFILIKWIRSGFGSLNEIKNSIMALTLLIIGIQTISSSFMLSILGIKGK